jgi:hypothetical protein
VTGEQQPPQEIELEPLEAHIVALRAELAHTRLLLLVGTAAVLLAALAVLYTAKSIEGLST